MSLVDENSSLVIDDVDVSHRFQVLDFEGGGDLDLVDVGSAIGSGDATRGVRLIENLREPHATWHAAPSAVDTLRMRNSCATSGSTDGWNKAKGSGTTSMRPRRSEPGTEVRVRRFADRGAAPCLPMCCEPD